MDVVAASTGEEAAETAAAWRPDVVLLDAGLPGLGGLDTTRRIRAGAGGPAEACVLLMLHHLTDAAIVDALHAGAIGLLTSDTTAQELLRAVRAAAAGDAVLGPDVAKRLIDDIVSRPQRVRSHPEQLEELTDREREVMALVASGLSNREIAAQLFISPSTAKTHVSRAMIKLHAHDRAQLAVLAYQTGLVLAGGPRAADAAAQRITGRQDAGPWPMAA
jgi:DNA-binding NarL/FixJ family response regulator